MNNNYAVKRKMMVENQIKRRGILDLKVLNAFMKVPRHYFVPDELKAQAYKDRPLPIGARQTISQPYIVAEMTRALQLQPDDKVLEIGTGSGYQAAILAQLVEKVYTIERIESLYQSAREIFANLNYNNIHPILADGTGGWKDFSPYDAILVAAASPEIPQPLVQQLNNGGKLVIPVGNQFVQELVKITKINGELQTENLGGCRFVKLVGEHGWPEN
ncbi:MAG: protein-L-isoaspartate(D-aspartate) O-methyltransferase [Deltaproteobacteria bacterium]|nr:protein-L-isoaspartate(D-aspartate) O-methyltransferase [Deltaproteobacteria bacterium]